MLGGEEGVETKQEASKVGSFKRLMRREPAETAGGFDYDEDIVQTTNEPAVLERTPRAHIKSWAGEASKGEVVRSAVLYDRG